MTACKIGIGQPWVRAADARESSSSVLQLIPESHHITESFIGLGIPIGSAKARFDEGLIHSFCTINFIIFIRFPYKMKPFRYY